MSTASASGQTQQTPSKPEKKIGRHVAVWRNAKGLRSVTVSYPSYRDPQTGEWRDGHFFRETDIALLAFHLFKALEYLHETSSGSLDAEEAT